MSLHHATSAQLAALNRLRYPEAEPVVAFLTEERHRQLAVLARADDPVQMYRVQGRIAALTDVLDLVETAEQRLAVAHRQPPGRP